MVRHKGLAISLCPYRLLFPEASVECGDLNTARRMVMLGMEVRVMCVVSRYMYVLLGTDLIASDAWGVTARHGNVLGRCLGACPY